MEKIKLFFVENWRGKVISLFIAISIWWVIKSHLDADRQSFPIPGTGSPTPRSTTAPIIDDSILNPLAPPIPGNSETR
jgi:hypothetical protein